MADKKATVHIDGHDPIELPIYEGTAGQDVIDVRTFGAHGYSLTTQDSCRPLLAIRRSHTSTEPRVCCFIAVIQSNN